MQRMTQALSAAHRSIQIMHNVIIPILHNLMCLKPQPAVFALMANGSFWLVSTQSLNNDHHHKQCSSRAVHRCACAYRPAIRLLLHIRDLRIKMPGCELVYGASWAFGSCDSKVPAKGFGMQRALFLVMVVFYQ